MAPNLQQEVRATFNRLSNSRANRLRLGSGTGKIRKVQIPTSEGQKEILLVLRASRHWLRLGQVVVRGCIAEGGAHGPRSSPNRLRRTALSAEALETFLKHFQAV